MNQPGEFINNDKDSLITRKKAQLSPKEVLFKYLHYWPWVALSLIIMLFLAFTKLRYSTPIYRIGGKILVKNDRQSRGSNEKFEDIFLMQGASSNLNDEIEILKSRVMAARVINTLQYQLSFGNKGNIRVSAIHPADMPFKFEVLSVKDSLSSFSITITILNENEFRLNDNKEILNFNQTIALPKIEFKLISSSISPANFPSNIFIVSWKPLEVIAADLSTALNVEQSGDFTNVLNLSYETSNPKIGLSIVNQYMEEYMKSSREDKLQQSESMLAFIDQQLDTVRYELGGVEQSLQKKREASRIFNSGQQSQLFFEEFSSSEKELTQQLVKLKVIDYLISYIKDKSNPYRKVTSTLGIEEPTLIQQVSEYNKLQVERETSLKTTTLSNPLIINYETAIEKIREDILENLQNIRKTYIVVQQDLLNKQKRIDQQLVSIPGKEKQLLEVTRQQNILQELYSFLLQKKLETSISSASTISNIKVLETARSSDFPISPNRQSIYILALFLGIIIPASLIALKEVFNDKISSKWEIQQLTDTPIVGEVGHSSAEEPLIVTKNNRSFIAEQFRMIRSNIQYVLPKSEKFVIMVTSSFSGEGKSFICTNLAAVLALSGKRTVILEFDIRKPKVAKGIGINAKKGLTNFIIGDSLFSEIIYQVKDTENLFVVPCGPIPPNPGELLLDNKIGQLFKQLREMFDIVIVDTAPIGLVSDADSVSKYVDATIYIARHNYTHKKQIQLLEQFYSTKKFANLALVINDVDADSNYGYSYGYSYGYGYGENYFDIGLSQRKKKNGFWKTIFFRK